MARLEVILVNESGRKIGYGDRWQTHHVKNGPSGSILGRKHIGITIALVDENQRILVVHRRHKIFDSVWTLSGDTHPYRKYGSQTVETLQQAASRCAMDDLGVKIGKWTKALTTSYSARDPRNPLYCENELLHVMVARHYGPLYMNEKNAYELQWVGLADISKDSLADMKKEPIDRKYAPWVHAILALPLEKVEEVLVAN